MLSGFGGATESKRSPCLQIETDTNRIDHLQQWLNRWPHPCSTWSRAQWQRARDEERKLEQLYSHLLRRHRRRSIDAAKAQQFDAILVLGGGVHARARSSSRSSRRAARPPAVWRAAATKPKILCLSAGTAHCPQLLDARGSVVFEATASAAESPRTRVDHHGRLCRNHILRHDRQRVLREDGSLLAGGLETAPPITMSHMQRTKAIFDWVFGTTPHEGFELSHLATRDESLAPDAIAARANAKRSQPSTCAASWRRDLSHAGGGPRIPGHEARPSRRPGPRGPREPAVEHRLRRAPPRVLRRRRRRRRAPRGARRRCGPPRARWRRHPSRALNNVSLRSSAHIRIRAVEMSRAAAAAGDGVATRGPRSAGAAALGQRRARPGAGRGAS